MNNAITNITLGPKYAEKFAMLTGLAEAYNEDTVLDRIPLWLLKSKDMFLLNEIDVRVKNRGVLTFEEAFWGMMHVVAATNNVVRTVIFPGMDFSEALSKGTYFLTVMAFKEAIVSLTSSEVAGIVAAGMVDLFYVPKAPSLIETAGTGADKAWNKGNNRVKTINASTLSAITLASMGYKTLKHGSYGNTSKVGSTDVPEQFGAIVQNQSPEEIERLLRETNFWFSDAHAVKTLHYLSHLLRVETVNHVAGPMTPPIGSATKLYKVMGVNQFIHPEVIAKAYVMLHKYGFVNLGGVVAMCGVKVTELNPKKLFYHADFLQDDYKQQVFLDEVGPDVTLVSLASGDKFLGTHLIYTRQDMEINVDEDAIQVPNEIQPLMQANQEALSGKRNSPFPKYLAANVSMSLLSMGLEAGCNLKMLPAFAKTALEHLYSGEVIKTLDKYVVATGGKRVYW